MRVLCQNIRLFLVLYVNFYAFSNLQPSEITRIGFGKVLASLPLSNKYIPFYLWKKRRPCDEIIDLSSFRGICV